MKVSKRRFELRDRTQARHRKLDDAIGFFDDRAGYCRYVAFLGTFRAAMDQALHDVIWPDDWAWRPTAVSAALIQDAADLGIRPTLPARAAIALADQSALMGSLYVLEGSTLGARVLKTRAAALGLTEDYGARHLALMAQDMSQWQSFLRRLDDIADFDVERAARAANAVFDLALQCFETERVAAG